MTEKMSEEDTLFEEAFDLIIRLQEEPENPVVHNLIARWRARHAMHETVWKQAMEIHGMAGMAIQSRHPIQVSKSAISRRTFVMGGTAFASLAAVAVVAPQVMRQLKADYLTTTAEMRHIALEDGTRIVLGPKSAIRSAMTTSERRVDLLQGMAFFDVAQENDIRPFLATADDLQVAGFGTAFDLSHDDNTRRIAVNHGFVQVNVAGSSDTETLSAGHWLALDESQHIARGLVDASQIATWRNGMLVAERERVATVVSHIARWQSGRVVIASAELGAQEISGVYDLNKPLEAMKAVVHPLGGRVRTLSPWLTILSTV